MIDPFHLRWWSLGFRESGWILHSQQSATKDQVPTSPLDLAHGIRTGADDLLDLSDYNDAGQHLLHLLSREGLRRVPHRAVGCDDGLRCHVVCVVTSLHALRTGKGRLNKRKGEFSFFFFFTIKNVPVTKVCVRLSDSPFEEIKVIKFNWAAKGILGILGLLLVHVIRSWNGRDRSASSNPCCQRPCLRAASTQVAYCFEHLSVLRCLDLVLSEGGCWLLCPWRWRGSSSCAWGPLRKLLSCAVRLSSGGNACDEPHTQSLHLEYTPVSTKRQNTPAV